MQRPWRRYCIALSLRLHIPINDLLNRLDAADIAEYIAYDLTQSEEWQAKWERQQQLEASRNMTPEQFKAAFMEGLGAAHG